MNYLRRGAHSRRAIPVKRPLRTDSVVNLNELIVSVTPTQKELRYDLVHGIRLQLEEFKRNILKSTPQLINHWTIAAFEDNVVPISDLIILSELVFLQLMVSCHQCRESLLCKTSNGVCL